MYYIIMGAVLALVSHTLMVIGTNMNCDMNNNSCFWKKIIDILVVVTHYIFISCIYGLSIAKENFSQDYWIMLVLCIISSIVNFYIFASQLPIFVKYIKIIHGKNAIMMVVSVIMGMLFSIAEIYFLLFTINPNWFAIDKSVGDGVIRIGFEFIYYTFLVSITYSGSSIEVIGIIPKIVQMIHILFFYLFAADVILKLVNKEK